jgi:hypothetical protein
LLRQWRQTFKAHDADARKRLQMGQQAEAMAGDGVKDDVTAVPRLIPRIAAKRWQLCDI